MQSTGLNGLLLGFSAALRVFGDQLGLWGALILLRPEEARIRGKSGFICRRELIWELLVRRSGLVLTLGSFAVFLFNSGLDSLRLRRLIRLGVPGLGRGDFLETGC